jgi:hypothetical protein
MKIYILITAFVSQGLLAQTAQQYADLESTSAALLVAKTEAHIAKMEQLEAENVRDNGILLSEVKDLRILAPGFSIEENAGEITPTLSLKVQETTDGTRWTKRSEVGSAVLSSSAQGLKFYRLQLAN